MKRKTLDFMNVGHILGRSEMKKLIAGSGGSDEVCTVTCHNCQNSSCTGEVDNCDTGIYQICGPGYHGSGGPKGVCTCSSSPW